MKRSGMVFGLSIPLLAATLYAAPPALRTQLSLNGTWRFYPNGNGEASITVPEYWDANPGFSCTWAKYERSIHIPSSWSGKKITIEFEQVNYVADVYVDGINQGQHIGGHVPFRIDLPNAVVGTTATIRVDVKGGSSTPIVNDSAVPMWPVGWYGHEKRWGICDDVYLRAYGDVSIEDAFIKPSVQNDQLSVVYTVKNNTGRSKTVTIQGNVKDGSSTVKSGTSSATSLSAGQTETITLNMAWTNPTVWTPDSPKLYTLESLVKHGSTTLDTETRRFGFREITISGNQFYLNGNRLNLRGSSINWQDQSYDSTRYTYMTTGSWPDTLNRYRSVNVNVLRFHQSAAQRHIIDACDEEGMLVVCESPVYSRDYIPAHNSTYISNSRIAIREMIKGSRNHPSIILWSAENEMRIYGSRLNNSEIGQLNDELLLHDNTRPLLAHGDTDVGGLINTWIEHYPEGYSHGYSGSIYKWAYRVKPHKPTGIGEFLTSYGKHGEANKWWQGTVVRGLRYINYAYIMPYQYQWIPGVSSDDERRVNVAQSLAPVALFDHAYDDLGIAPIRDNSYPSLTRGANVTRSLDLYNDEFSGTAITVEVRIKKGSTVYATGSSVFTLALGERTSFDVGFQVPYTTGPIEMELKTKKGSTTKFTEIYNFNLSGGGSGDTSGTVTINGGGQ